MLVISGKRIKIILGCVFIAIFAFTFQIASEKENAKVQNVIPTTATPVSGKTIIIDAGHGVPDERNSLLTLKNNIDLLQKIKCFKHVIFFMLKRRLIYAKQRIW